MYGAETMLLNLAVSLEAQGCQNVLAVFENQHRPHTEVADCARARGLAVQIVPCRGRMDGAAVARIRSLIRNDIDVVHTHGYKAAVYGYWAARGLRVPLVATCHNWADQALHMQFYGLLDCLIMGRFQKVFAVSEPVAARLRRFVAVERISVIANGIDVTQFSNAVATLGDVLRPKPKRVVGMVGRLVVEKGPELFLRAAQELLPAYPDTLFVLVGEGPARKHLEEMAQQMGIRERVIFAGERRDMPGVYASLDIMVLPSFNEGMPMTVLEAMAAGKAVVASAVGAIPTAVIAGKTGLLVPPRDTTALSRAIGRLLASPELASDLGRAAQAHVARHFSAAAMAQEYLAAYSGLRLTAHASQLQPATVGPRRAGNPRSA